MVNRGAWLVLFMLLAPTRARADEDTKPAPLPSNPSALQQATQKARFKALVAKAERERRAGRLAEAATAYAEAFELEQDPLVAGRLGVLLVEFGNPTEAADLLLDAIERATNAPAAEREKFLKAYDTARARVCRVEVTVSEAHAEIALDGVVKQTDGITGFTMFLPPGEHELRAKLKGFEDGVSSFTASKGGTLRVELSLLPVHTLVPIEPAPSISPPSSPGLAMPDSTAAATTAPVSLAAPTRPAPSLPLTPPRRWTPAFGATMLYGAVSPLPAFGLVASSEWPLREVFSWRIDLRGALSSRGIEGAAIRGALVGAWPGLCGTVRGFSGCLLASAGALNRSVRNPDLSQWLPFVGFGAGGAAALSLGPVDLRVSLDAVVLVSSYSLKLGGIDGEAQLWGSHPLLAGLSVAAAVR